MIFFEFPEVFRGCKVEIPLIERCRLCLARDLLTDAELARGSSTGTSRLLVHSSRRRHHPGIKSDSANFCKNKRKQAPNGVLALSRKNNNRTNHKHERETNETVQKRQTRCRTQRPSTYQGFKGATPTWSGVTHASSRTPSPFGILGHAQ